MSILSATLGRVRPSPTIAMTSRARALRAEGRDIISLSAGEPDFDTPAHVREAAKAAIDAGHTRYTNPDGIAELKAAIREKFRRENAITYADDEVMVSAGGKQVIFNAFVATLDPGDEVVIPAPYWVSYPDMVTLAGGSPVIVPTSAEDRFCLRPEALESAITPRTKWLVLNSPSNPTGSAYSAEELAALADVLRRHPDVWVLSDDIYEHILFDDLRFATIAAVDEEMRARTLTVNGVSKAYAMTGWRIGYGGGPAPLVRAMVKVQSQSTSCPPSVSQHAALAALTGPQDFIATARAAFRRRRDLVVQRLDEAPGIVCPRPEGAFYVYPSIADCIGRQTREGRRIKTDEDFAMALLEEAGVAVVFGAAFGLSPHFRVSYATDDRTLEDACARIAEFTAALV
ncbi:MAG: pyridoxal phosphate-dependent aminotransferase [Alphaproteobacteria bacterium]|nr:MAG: pyridoxal phosphate-dependent aminotransferase [Alphaproteobacteria bacterium]